MLSKQVWCDKSLGRKSGHWMQEKVRRDSWVWLLVPPLCSPGRKKLQRPLGWSTWVRNRTHSSFVWKKLIRRILRRKLKHYLLAEMISHAWSCWETWVQLPYHLPSLFWVKRYLGINRLRDADCPIPIQSKAELSRQGEFGRAKDTLGMKGGVNPLYIIEIRLVNCHVLFAFIDSWLWDGLPCSRLQHV